MPSSRKPLEIDAGRIFRWSLLLVFLAFEWIIWTHVFPRAMGRPGRKMLFILLAPWADRRVVVSALLMAGVITVAGMLFVRMVLAPILNLWLNPAFDPSSWLFHLSAGEVTEASIPARFRSGGGWRPGALVLTGRRLWFLPAAWGPEPWSIARNELARVEAEPPALARLLPVRHWPDRLVFTDRAGEHAAIAVADPDAVLSWFAPTRGGDVARSRPRVVPEGVFDA